MLLLVLIFFLFVAAVGIYMVIKQKGENEKKRLENDLVLARVSFTSRENEVVQRMEKAYSKEKERRLEKSL